MSFASSDNTFSTVGGNTSTNNLEGVDPLFVNLPHGSSYSFSYDPNPQPGSMAIGNGEGGTDIGLFGGGSPFDITGTPLPLIQVVDVPPTISQGSDLPVNIKEEEIKVRKLVVILTFISMSISGWAQSNIIAAEYFFDTDPGMGAALPISGIASATNIDVNDLIDVSSLSIGMHTLGIRVMDDNNVWSMAEYIPVFVTLASATLVSDITSAEYFFDTDPGLGGAIPISLTSIQNIDINELFPTSSLSFGMHTLNIRIKNQYNEWSMTESIPVFVTSANANIVDDIDRVEYFFDTDPGFGSGLPIAVSAAQNIDINDLIPTAPLAMGMHTLNVRIRTINGEWSIAESIPVYVDQNNQITQLEHFVDVDPGVGSATNVAIAPPTNNLDFNLNVPTTSLSVGPHTLAVRLGGINNIWGVTEYVAFNICTGANANFSSITTCIGDVTSFTDLSTNVLGGDTYSWDFDGDLVEDDNTVGSTNFTYLTTGSYVATLTIDRAGCPSIFSMVVDVVNPPTASVGANVTICAGNPANLSGSIGGSASTVTWSGGAGSFDNVNSLTPIYTHDASEIGVGPVTLTMTTDDPLGTCIATSASVTIDVLSPPTANSGGNFAICNGSTANLSGSIGGAASSSTWTTSGDGTFDNVGLLNAVYTPGVTDLANGAVNLTLTTDDPDGPGSCSAGIDMLTLSIDPAASANAGIDITICATDMAALTGTMNASSANPMWSTSGSGTFSSANTLNSIYTPSAADITAGSITLTLTVDGIGICPQVTDQLVVTIAAPIVAGAPSIQSNIGQVSNVDVIAASTINTGDVITVSILQNPTKGTVSILGNNTIDYTPSTGTVGADSFDYQICNQCSLCSSGTVTINIVNAPPVITPPTAPITSIAGQSVTIPFLSLTSDINDNIDPASIKIIAGPISNAMASFDVSYNLTIDYSSTPFSGTDQITVEVCDFLSACSQITLLIEVDGSITINNGISPNGDGMNDYFRINNIQFLEPQNTVSIFNRWGDKVFEMENYDSSISDRRFEGMSNSGKSLSSGVYFYKVDFKSGRKSMTGYLTLKR